MATIFERPWGNFRVIEENGNYKVKLLEISPKKSISLQYHLHRREIWTVIAGDGYVYLDGSLEKISPGNTIVIPKGSHHKVTNISKDLPLKIIEVQYGDLLDDEDIVRLDQ